ncbi:MAG: glycosyltransferase family 2 protein [Candidatus Hermodarchaeota archaeon]
MSNENVFLSVVAPAYNEEENIRNVIGEWQAVLSKANYNSEIVIANDGSTDKTREILETLTFEYPNLSVVHSEKNMGYGDALFKAIYASKGEYVVTIDSDGQFELSDYSRLLDECIKKKYDVVTGYRTGKKDTFMRVLADRALNSIVRVLFGLKFKDTNCALKVYQGELIRSLTIEARAYPTPTEILIRLKNKGVKIGEMAIQHKHRIGGQSHLKLLQTGWSTLLFLIYMRIKLFLKKFQIITRI